MQQRAVAPKLERGVLVMLNGICVNFTWEIQGNEDLSLIPTKCFLSWSSCTYVDSAFEGILNSEAKIVLSDIKSKKHQLDSNSGRTWGVSPVPSTCSFERTRWTLQSEAWALSVVLRPSNEVCNYTELQVCSLSLGHLLFSLLDRVDV